MFCVCLCASALLPFEQTFAGTVVGHHNDGQRLTERVLIACMQNQEFSYIGWVHVGRATNVPLCDCQPVFTVFICGICHLSIEIERGFNVLFQFEWTTVYFICLASSHFNQCARRVHYGFLVNLISVGQIEFIQFLVNSLWSNRYIYYCNCDGVSNGPIITRQSDAIGDVAVYLNSTVFQIYNRAYGWMESIFQGKGNEIMRFYAIVEPISGLTESISTTISMCCMLLDGECLYTYMNMYIQSTAFIRLRIQNDSWLRRAATLWMPAAFAIIHLIKTICKISHFVRLPGHIKLYIFLAHSGRLCFILRRHNWIYTSRLNTKYVFIPAHRKFSLWLTR